jgi:protein MAK16
MNHDEVTWNVMGQVFCSFKVKTRDDKVRFCRNPYNVTGLCQKGVCPLANSQYATIIEHEDELYLYVKTAERAHLPRRMWEKIKLSTSFPQALEQIDENLQWWDKKLVNKVKARLLRLKQYLMRKRKMLMEPEVKYVSVNKRQEHKLLRREVKAEAAARIELEIEKELLDRLKKGTYDSVINANKEAFEALLDAEEDTTEYDELADLEDEEDAEDLEDFVMDDDEEEDEDYDEEEELGAPKRKKSRLVIEREVEYDSKAKKTQRDELDW